MIDADNVVLDISDHNIQPVESVIRIFIINVNIAYREIFPEAIAGALAVCVQGSVC